MTIEAVLFDADGVVQRQRAGWSQLLGGLIGPEADIEAFCRDIFAAEAPSLVGERDFTLALEGVLHKWKCTVPVSQALQVWEAIVVDEGVVAQIKTLRARGTYCGLATNQQAYRAAFMGQQMGYTTLFDRSFYSCELGYRKPAPGYFRAVLQGLPFPPGQVLFIDDSPANVEAACTAGLAGVLFQPGEGVEWAGPLRSLLAVHGLAAA
ncbi:MAG: HAD-IA family hydrolase [Candidatus Latescibacteria bacterium]|nr:HAD-IA family hydrolase [Candidatus Latescibacterota bacterium]